MTWVSAVAESDIIVKVLNNKLTPELNKYIDVAKSELEYGWHIDLPQPDGMCRSYHVFFLDSRTNIHDINQE